MPGFFSLYFLPANFFGDVQNSHRFELRVDTLITASPVIEERTEGSKNDIMPSVTRKRNQDESDSDEIIDLTGNSSMETNGYINAGRTEKGKGRPEKSSRCA